MIPAWTNFIPFGWWPYRHILGLRLCIADAILDIMYLVVVAWLLADYVH